MLKSEEERDLDRAARLAGEAFVLERELDPKQLSRAAASLGSDEVPMPRALARYLLARAGGPAPIPPRRRQRFPLTGREQQVLSLLAAGASNKAIGRSLGISEHGAKRHVANILGKLNCENRTGAVAKALAEGLLVGDQPDVA